MSERVRLPFVPLQDDSEGPAHEVVRIRTQGGKKVRRDGDKVLVALRHQMRWSHVIMATSFAEDRAMSYVVSRLVMSPLATQLRRDAIASEILTARGRPSTDTERTINQSVERATSMGGWTYDVVGDYRDQAYYLGEIEIGVLEELARTLELCPGRVVDALVAAWLSSGFRQLDQ